MMNKLIPCIKLEMNKKSNRIDIKHTTVYSYVTEVRYAIQRVYLSPRPTNNNRVINWEVKTNCDLVNQIDSFGNKMHLLIVKKPCKRIVIEVTGKVDVSLEPKKISKTQKNKIYEKEFSNIFLFQRPTNLTLANDEIKNTAKKIFNSKSQLKSLLLLTEFIENKIEYIKGATEVGTTAIEAWNRGAGVCQDHAHVMIAACRSIGLSARYVSGYLQGESDASEATHAWVEVWIDRWIAIDVTHKKLINDKFLSLAVGTDYLSVSPIRGVREGGGKESMNVNVSVKN